MKYSIRMSRVKVISLSKSRERENKEDTIEKILEIEIWGNRICISPRERDRKKKEREEQNDLKGFILK
jgi:hypothetical protein